MPVSRWCYEWCQDGGRLIVYVKARQRIGSTAGQLSGHLWSSPKNVGGLRSVGVGVILMILMVMLMTLITMTMVMVGMMGSSVSIFGLLLRMWVVAGLCGGGALGAGVGQARGKKLLELSGMLCGITFRPVPEKL